MTDLATGPLRGEAGTEIVATIPPHAFFLVSAVFHYLGPAFAVLLFAQLAVLGVAWLRVATAAAVFAVWRRPWRLVGAWPSPSGERSSPSASILGVMNACSTWRLPACRWGRSAPSSSWDRSRWRR